MSNFDFLKNFNNELYQIGNKLEEDVIESPRAVTADATLFLETLVKDIYKLSKNKLDTNLISFYKKIDNLYRSGEISYIYKNKLQDAYSLRNKIHKNYLNKKEEENIAFDLHKRLYYISKKYFKDYCDNEKYVNIPKYKKPTYNLVKFENCIICGSPNKESLSNICVNCNKKIENANFLLNIQNIFNNESFTRNDLTNIGISESESISTLMDLSKENVVLKKGSIYTFNEDKVKKYLDEVTQYVEISSLITKFYKDEITSKEIKNTLEYWKGSIKQKPYVEFYNLVNKKIEKKFEENLSKFQNIKKSMRKSSMDELNIKEWYEKEKREFINGNLNDAFILYNEILINQFFKLEKKGLSKDRILKQLDISNDIYEFWKDEFMGDEFLKQTSNIKKEILIKEIRKNKTLDNALKSSGFSKKEFEKVLLISQGSNDEFYKSFQKGYVEKRQKTLVKHLQNNNLNKAIRLTKITKEEFLDWYYKSERELSQFYLKTTEILMDKYLSCRRNGWNKQHILNYINISKELFQSWYKHETLGIFINFEEKNKEITSHLLKRGLLINNIKEGKSKQEAISDSGLTFDEFREIYNASKKEKSNFYLRFDIEYAENRKKLFTKLIKNNDFFNSIEKCEISQTDFNKWYLLDQDKFISSHIKTEFYTTTTKELMNKYLQARRDGKNKPDSARSVGLSNIIINKWIKHPEFDLYYDFKKKNNQLTIDLISKGFKKGQSKIEVSQNYDISQKTIDKFINLGKSGFMKYEKINELYENRVIPNQLNTFLENFKTKTIKKALNISKLSSDDLKHYYQLGNDGDEKFTDFSKKFLNLKIELYVNNIISKKSPKIAYKNSAFDKKEFLDNKAEIEDKILYKRINIAANEIMTHNTNGHKLANKLGVSIDEIYDWYFKGKNGEPKYKEFFIIFELAIIFPQVTSYNQALEIGIPKNWLYKKIKKEIGANDFKIWEKHDILNQTNSKTIVYCGEDLNDEKLKEMIQNFEFIKDCEEKTDLQQLIESNLFKGHCFTKTVISVDDGKVVKKEIIGD